MVLTVLNVSSLIGPAGEMFSREAEGQHSQDQLPNVEKFSSIGRNSLSLDIFSPLNDGKIAMLLHLHFSCIVLVFSFHGSIMCFSILSVGFKTHGFGDTPTSRNGECFHLFVYYVQSCMAMWHAMITWLNDCSTCRRQYRYVLEGSRRSALHWPVHSRQKQLGHLFTCTRWWGNFSQLWPLFNMYTYNRWHF